MRLRVFAIAFDRNSLPLSEEMQVRPEHENSVRRSIICGTILTLSFDLSFLALSLRLKPSTKVRNGIVFSPNEKSTQSTKTCA